MTPMSATGVVDNTAESRFEILADGELAGYAVYRTDGAALAFTHTVVEPRFEGKGIGSALAAGALNAARERGVPVLPYCPFIRSYIQRHPVYVDLVPAERRAGFGLTTGETTSEQR
jgi:predicted GNAT family acetyltransferase